MKKEQAIMVRHGDNTHTPLLREEMLFTIKTQHKGGVRRAEREAETRHNKKLLPPFQEDDALIQYSPPFRRRRGERPRHSKTRNSSPLPLFRRRRARRDNIAHSSPFSGGGRRSATRLLSPPPFQEEEGTAQRFHCLLPHFWRRRLRRNEIVVSSLLSGGGGRGATHLFSLPPF